MHAKPPKSLAGDGTLRVSDAVSPCPEGATCFWSGIVTRSGTWRLDGDLLQLAYAGSDDQGFGLAYFKELLVRRDCDGNPVLVEARNDGRDHPRVPRSELAPTRARSVPPPCPTRPRPTRRSELAVPGASPSPGPEAC